MAAYASPGGTHIYVSDQLNFRAQTFTTLGAFQSEFATGGGQNLDIAVNSAGDSYFPDATNHRVVKVSSTGALTSWGTQGSGDGQFVVPQGIGLDAAGKTVRIKLKR